MRRALPVLTAVALLAVAAPAATAAPAGARGAVPARAPLPAPPAPVDGLQLATPATASGDGRAASALDPSLASATGRVKVVVRLKERAVAELSKGRQTRVAATEERSQAGRVSAAGDGVLARARQLDRGLEVLGRTRIALPSVILRMDAAAARALIADPRVARITPVRTYSLDLSEVPAYVGARRAAAAAPGADGTGVVVSVIDSGVDYTHAKLAGPGTSESYARAYGVSPPPTEYNPALTANTRTSDGAGSYFPTAKVIGGFDYLGEEWRGGDDPIRPDPNPIDREGHGTHVSDIIAGVNRAPSDQPSNAGMAPGASLLVFKACASFASSCEGGALLQSVDASLDPNGDGDTRDGADVINMSLGSDYGLAPYDDLSAASEAASAAGVLVVASAGNGSDKPFIAGTPADAPSVLSVAQTNVPSARTDALVVTGAATGTFEAAFQPFTPRPTSPVSGPIKDSPTNNRNGCATYPAGFFNGTIALVDRGTCTISEKSSRTQAAGAIATIVALVAPGDPQVFSFGEAPEGAPTKPTYNIKQADARTIRTGLSRGAVNGSIDPNSAPSAAGTITGSSSRGPSSEDFLVKPEIGAPGASVSAVAGSNDQTQAFGGTSGAAPVVAGAAALVLSRHPGRRAADVKALLMNTAERAILSKPASFGGTPLPITRIGGGEVRVDRAVESQGVAQDANSPSAALSFGQPQVTGPTTLTKQVLVRNYGTSATTYTIASSFQFADDASAARVRVPSSVAVPARGTARFTVSLDLDPATLKAWRLNSGSNGTNPGPLTDSEIDGYITLTPSSGQQLGLPFQVLPRITADIQQPAQPTRGAGGSGTVPLRNQAAGTAGVDAYTLIDTSPQLPPGQVAGQDDDRTGRRTQNPEFPELAGLNYRPTDLKTVSSGTFGVASDTCDNGFLVQFAFTTHDRQTLLVNSGGFQVGLDRNNDGTEDAFIYTGELSTITGTALDGRVVSVGQVGTGEKATRSAFFFADHGVNSSTTVLTVCAEQIGLTLADIGRSIPISVVSYDPYFTGLVSDSIPDSTFVPGRERYVGDSVDVPAGSTVSLPFTDAGRVGTYGRGLVLITDAPRANNVRVGHIDDNEARVIELEPGSPPPAVGSGPDPVIPEAPVALLLPLLGLGLGIGAFGLALVRRRRRGPVGAAA